MAVAAAAAGAGWWLGSGMERTVPGPIKPLTTYRGFESGPALSPDGSQIAFAWDGEKGDNTDIYVRLVDGGAAIRLTRDPAPDLGPTWSPDSRRIAFTRNNAIYIVPALGGEERKLVQFAVSSGIGQSRYPPQMSWSRDGKWLAYSAAESGSPPAVWVIAPDGGEPRRVTKPVMMTFGSGGGDFSPAFSPDGSKLAFVRSRDLYSRAVLIQQMAGGVPAGEPKEITSYEQSIVDLEWADDGRSLIASIGIANRSALWRIDLRGNFVRLPFGGTDEAQPSVSRTGNRLAYQSRQIDINIYRLDGPGQHGGPEKFDRCHLARVIDSTTTDREPILSLDGRRLLFNSNRTGTSEIYVADSDGSHQVALTSMGPTSVGSPRWSADGSLIVFDRYEHGHSAIYTIPAEGGRPRQLTGDNTTDIRPSFSRDGKWIYFTSSRTGTTEAWKMPVGGGAAQQLTKGKGGADLFESPDGRDLFFYRADGLWTMPAAGGEPKLVLPEVTGPLYALAGRSIYYLKLQPPAVWVYRLDTGQKFEYVRFPAGTPPIAPGGTNMTVSADEHVIMLTMADRREADLMLVENFR